MKTIAEKNKLIAEFMGFINPYADIYQCCFGNINNSVSPENMRFNSSWEWLMPVVEKIEDIRIEPDTEELVSYHRFSVNMVIHQCTIIDNATDETVGDGDNATKLLSTFDAIVEFIQWYNEQK